MNGEIAGGELKTRQEHVADLLIYQNMEVQSGFFKSHSVSTKYE